jgi:catechol 2,3-dioxygenase-like lactoylglutathione lyase family enzyme
MIKTNGINHIVLTVSNLRREHQFYEIVFDAQFDMNWNKKAQAGSFSLKNAGQYIFFVQRGGKEVCPSDKFDHTRVGLDHFAFGVDDEKELEKILSNVKKAWNVIDSEVTDGKTKGIEICEYAGFKYFCLRDPENIQVEFYMNHK